MKSQSRVKTATRVPRASFGFLHLRIWCVLSGSRCVTWGGSTSEASDPRLREMAAFALGRLAQVLIAVALVFVLYFVSPSC